MMDDGMLSQDEIDALLNVTDDNDDHEEKNEQQEDAINAYLSVLEKDTIGEIGNISLGNSATTLSTLLGKKVEITTPVVSIVKKTGFKEEFPFEHVSLQVNYIEGFDGQNIFLMKALDAAIISDIMLGGDGLHPNEELSEIELSAVQEAMNQMMGASATSMSTIFDKKIDISPPSVKYEQIDELEEVKNINEEDVFVKVSFQLKINGLIDSQIMQLIPLQFAKELVEQLLKFGKHPSEVEPTEVEQTNPIHSNGGNEMPTETAQMKNIEMSTNNNSHSNQSNVQTASFSTFENIPLTKQNERNLEMLLDIQLKVAVELGKTKRTVKDILDLSHGSIVELDKLAGEPVDVLVNDKLIAKGEVVVIDENFGVRVTDKIGRASCRE